MVSKKYLTVPVFHEAVLRLPKPASEVLSALDTLGVLGGFDLSQAYPELDNAILVCATETKTDDDLEQYATALHKTLA